MLPITCIACTIIYMKAKRAVYIILSMFFGLILSIIAHVISEVLYLRYAERITWYNHIGSGSCALHPISFYGIFIIGLLGGYMLGRFWWRMVYIEKRHWHNKKNDFDESKEQ